MTNEIPRLSRLTSILLMLQSNKAISISSITAKYRISKRTAYRDIKALEQAGVPIFNNEKGFSLMDTYNLPPIMFSEEEANTLITIEKIIENHNDKSLIKNYENAISKIKATLKYSKKEKVEFLSDRIKVLKKDKNKSDNLETIQKAIVNQNKLKISYCSIYKNELTERTIEPLGLYFTNENWIMIAWCNLRHDNREFRIDKIQQIQSCNQTFHREFELSDYFSQVIQKSEMS